MNLSPASDQTEAAIFARAVDACASGKVSFFRFSPEQVLWLDRQINIWRDRYEAERRDHEATMAHCDAHHIDPRA